jgi:hypothetical protein
MSKGKKSQRYPSSIIKVGAVLYSVLAWVNESGKAEVELQEWIVRSIKRRRGSQTKYGVKTFSSDSEYSQRQYVNITHKEKGVTWGKLSRKHFDFGWLKSIPVSHRNKFAVGENLPFGIYTTKLAAYQHAFADAKDSIKWYEDKIKTLLDDERQGYLIELDEHRKEYTAIERRLKRLRSIKS